MLPQASKAGSAHLRNALSREWNELGPESVRFLCRPASHGGVDNIRNAMYDAFGNIARNPAKRGMHRPRRLRPLSGALPQPVRPPGQPAWRVPVHVVLPLLLHGT